MVSAVCNVVYLLLRHKNKQTQGEEHMKYEDIKFFSERCEEHPDHQSGTITNSMIQQRLHEEIDELREYIEKALKDKNNNAKT